MDWETVIGLEVHVRLTTASKLFSGAPNAYGAEPNRQASAVDIALPGVLPVMNEAAARMAIKFGLAIGAEINQRSVFARKNYFYPDLPKGYQISQYELPIVGTGRLKIELDDTTRFIGITRAHLEEDAGKSLHEDFKAMTGIDLNRAGTPLIEIVSEPDMRNAREAVAYLKTLHALVRYLEICDGNMQEGSFRCDANVSLRPRGGVKLGTRTELKNINSFRFVERAIEFEIERQAGVLESGGQVVQETRLFDPDRNETRPMRSKEDAHDYRYFPDPDLPPLLLDDAFIEAVRKTLPELPGAKLARLVAQYHLPVELAGQLTEARPVADYFEQTVAAGALPQHAAHWITGELFAQLNRSECDIEHAAITPTMLGGLLKRIADRTISGKTAKDVFQAMWDGAGDADTIIEARGLTQITDASAIEQLIDDVLAASPAQVTQYRTGEVKVLGYLVGQVMKASRGQANPQQVNAILRQKLDG